MTLWVLGAVVWCAFGLCLHVWVHRRYEDVTLEDLLMSLLFCWMWPVSIILEIGQHSSNVVVLKNERVE